MSPHFSLTVKFRLRIFILFLNIYSSLGRLGGSVKGPTLAQVVISRFMGSNPASGSARSARSLEPASDSVSLSLSAPPRCCFFSLKNK